MPGICNRSRHANSVHRAKLGLFSIAPVFSVLVACNGQTAFVEQSRAWDAARTQVASADADAYGKRRSSVNPERPVDRSNDSDGHDSVNHGNGDDSIGRGSQNGDSSNSDGEGDGIDEQKRGRPGDEMDVPGDLNPGKSDDAVGQPAPVPSPMPPQPTPLPPQKTPAPPQATPVPPQPTPVPTQPPPAQPRAGEIVSVQLTQPRAQVDILWVVDNSGSMAWAQNQLKSKFQAFAQKLKDTRVDFQVGVTSLDVCKVDSSTGFPIPDGLCPDVDYIPSGVKVGNKIVGPLRGTLQNDPSTGQTILRDTSDFVQAFQRTALLGTKGSAFEHGLWAAKMAIEKSLSSGGENRGFIRPNASLSVVVLSDEEDDSVQMWCEDGYGRTSTNASGKKDLTLCKEGGRSPFLDAFGIAPYALMKNEKGAPYTTHKFTADDFKAWASATTVKGDRNFRVSAITGLRGTNGEISCGLSSGGPEESGTNYIKAAQLTGGAVENICSSDWSNVLANVGQNTVELATRVSLPAGKVPFAGTLEVRVNGLLLNMNQYSYDRALHAVVFTTPPAMGSEVVVSYRETVLVD